MSLGDVRGIQDPLLRTDAIRETFARNNTAQQQLNDSSNDESQETTATHDSDRDRVFTPPESDSGASSGPVHANGNGSSQESQLFQLSELAAAQEKMTEAAQSRKRTADGAVKYTRDSMSTSPVRASGHSRNTSTVSATSTTGSRIGELSAELKAKLSYAMMKVNHGWQSNSIDEVESLASQAASPISSTSTIHGRPGANPSPRLSLTAMRQGTQSAGISPVGLQASQGRANEAFWRDTNVAPQNHSVSPPASQASMLAPPAAIQPGRSGHLNPRRNSNARHTPAYLSHQASPRSPAQPSPLQSTPGTATLRTPQVDQMVFSPHQNVREQEALETLLFMSSPGNSANMKHALPSSAQQGPNNIQAHRTALPTSRLAPNSQPRKTLPTIRHHAHGSIGKRVGFEKSPGRVSEMDVDDHYASPRGTPRRKTFSGSRPSLSVPAGLNAPSRPRPQLQDADIERMLDRVAADDSSDSESEISLPAG
ncbi:hypothetical protein PFICI_05508 [Pestalotiopsis fici W106-1]|uniref:Uncharacterized protein n=1 Tax=Pestalotiopsis fici (strain W106-1 / CGMCC3.15140) TaxID=1229662 RepID=W3XDX8_PESFW|nr:uncharacterized protein PFICI_05508 [Pestalotiopsis fici W106-1]ETS83632.1 hypothetical protein PFICI_05508 [Pestalotiopsis fici W106-1]